MTDFLGSVAALAVVLGILITVHEFGHFAVARSLGVKVLRFSIGFGKPIWRRRSKRDGTEYAISAIPLGGYVKMLDEREGEVPAAELHRAFNRQSISKRFAIVVAGPLFNFLFAVFAFWLMFITGVPGIKAVIGDIVPGSPADKAGLRSGEQIVAVDGRDTPTWASVFDALLPKVLLGEPATVTVTHDHLRMQKRMELTQAPPDAKADQLIDGIGLRPYSPPVKPLIGDVIAGSPAAKAGLRAGDLVVAIDDKPVGEWDQFVKEIEANPEKPLSLRVQRGGQQLTVQVRPRRVETEQGPVGKIGAQVRIDDSGFKALQTEWRHGPAQAVVSSVQKTWEMSALTVQMFGEMIVGRASVDNISGPITIARYAKESADAGFSRFLLFLAVVSISLGVLNLFPIPVLDGGHLLFYVVEAVKGSPVSERTEAIGQRIGIAFIIALMTLAFYNDLARLAG